MSNILKESLLGWGGYKDVLEKIPLDKNVVLSKHYDWTQETIDVTDTYYKWTVSTYTCYTKTDTPKLGDIAKLKDPESDSYITCYVKSYNEALNTITLYDYSNHIGYSSFVFDSAVEMTIPQTISRNYIYPINIDGTKNDVRYELVLTEEQIYDNETYYFDQPTNGIVRIAWKEFGPRFGGTGCNILKCMNFDLYNPNTFELIDSHVIWGYSNHNFSSNSTPNNQVNSTQGLYSFYCNGIYGQNYEGSTDHGFMHEPTVFIYSPMYRRVFAAEVGKAAPVENPIVPAGNTSIKRSTDVCTNVYNRSSSLDDLSDIIIGIYSPKDVQWDSYVENQVFYEVKVNLENSVSDPIIPATINGEIEQFAKISEDGIATNMNSSGGSIISPSNIQMLGSSEFGCLSVVKFNESAFGNSDWNDFYILPATAEQNKVVLSIYYTAAEHSFYFRRVLYQAGEVVDTQDTTSFTPNTTDLYYIRWYSALNDDEKIEISSDGGATYTELYSGSDIICSQGSSSYKIKFCPPSETVYLTKSMIATTVSGNTTTWLPAIAHAYEMETGVSSTIKYTREQMPMIPFTTQMVMFRKSNNDYQKFTFYTNTYTLDTSGSYPIYTVSQGYKYAEIPSQVNWFPQVLPDDNLLAGGDCRGNMLKINSYANWEGYFSYLQSFMTEGSYTCGLVLNQTSNTYPGAPFETHTKFPRLYTGPRYVSNPIKISEAGEVARIGSTLVYKKYADECFASVCILQSSNHFKLYVVVVSETENGAKCNSTGSSDDGIVKQSIVYKGKRYYIYTEESTTSESQIQFTNSMSLPYIRFDSPMYDSTIAAMVVIGEYADHKTYYTPTFIKDTYNNNTSNLKYSYLLPEKNLIDLELHDAYSGEETVVIHPQTKAIPMNEKYMVLTSVNDTTQLPRYINLLSTSFEVENPQTNFKCSITPNIQKIDCNRNLEYVAHNSLPTQSHGYDFEIVPVAIATDEISSTLINRKYLTPGTYKLFLEPGFYQFGGRSGGGAGGESSSYNLAYGGCGGSGELFNEFISIYEPTEIEIQVGSGGLTYSEGGNGGFGGDQTDAPEYPGCGGGGGRPSSINIVTEEFSRALGKSGGGGGGGAGAYDTRPGRYADGASGGGGGGLYMLSSFRNAWNILNKSFHLYAFHDESTNTNYLSEVMTNDTLIETFSLVQNTEYTVGEVLLEGTTLNLIVSDMRYETIYTTAALVFEAVYKDSDTVFSTITIDNIYKRSVNTATYNGKKGGKGGVHIS